MHLRTLGGLKLEGSNFGRTKPLLLLCYLALEGPKERRHLAELFWPGATNPLGSLSTALGQLRQGAPGSFAADQVRVRTELQTDAKQLLAALDKQAHESASSLYTGRFLDGVHLHDWSTELEEWVYRTREFLASRLRAMLLRTAEADAAKGQFELAAKRADLAYLLSGAPEPEPEELERLYTLMLAGGSPQLAEVRKEAKGFGISLLLTLEEAQQKLSGMRRSAQATPHNLTPQPTPFVGRGTEITALSEKLRDPQCRLLTIVGPGGSGKTRLATELLQGQLETFKDGVYFVSFLPVSSPASMAHAVSDSLELRLSGQEEPQKQLIDLVKDEVLLLVLDNLEHGRVHEY